MTWALILTDRARADIRHLDPPLRQRIIERLEWLAGRENPFHHIDGLQGRPDFSFRIGRKYYPGSVDGTEFYPSYTTAIHSFSIAIFPQFITLPSSSASQLMMKLVPAHPAFLALLDK